MIDNFYLWLNIPKSDFKISDDDEEILQGESSDMENSSLKQDQHPNLHNENVISENFFNISISE